MTHQCRGCDDGHHKKAHGDLIMVFGHKTIHINLPLIGPRKSKIWKLQGQKSNLKVLYWYTLNISRMLTDCTEDESIAMCENANALSLADGSKEQNHGKGWIVRIY